MAKRATKPKPEATGQTKPDVPSTGATAPAGAADAVPATQPATDAAAAVTVGQAAAETDQGAVPPSAVADEAKPEEANPATATRPTLVVVGPKAGRWRAKRFFGPEPVSIQLDSLTEAEIALITADPVLTVTTVDAPY